MSAATPAPARALLALLLGLCALLRAGDLCAEAHGPAPAAWDRATPEQRRTATLLFEDARQHLYGGFLAQAAEDYRQALQRWPHPIIHFNLALTLINLDDPVEADAHLARALEHGPRGLADDGARFEYARQKRAELGRRLATIEVSCRTAGARITIDDAQVLTVARGQPPVIRTRIRTDQRLAHKLSAELPGGEVVIEWRAIRSGETVRVELEPKPRPVTWASWTLLGGAALTGLAGGALQWRAQASYDVAEQQQRACVSMGTRCDFGRWRDRADTMRTLGVVSFSLAGAAAVVAGAMLLNRPTAHRFKRFTISPLVTAGGGGGMLMGRF